MRSLFFRTASLVLLLAAYSASATHASVPPSTLKPGFFRDSQDQQQPLGVNFGQNYDNNTSDMSSGISTEAEDFAFKTAKGLFSPHDLVELPRPGAGVANPAGDIVFVAVSKYSFKDKENTKYLLLASTAAEGKVPTFEIPLAKGGDTFWLDSRTLAHVVPSSKDAKVQEIYAITIKFTSIGFSLVSPTSASTYPLAPSTAASPKLIGSFPSGSSASNFRYNAATSTLVFSSYVYPDCDLKTVKSHDEKWENRGNTALVYDETFVRHWDTWRGPKRSSLFVTTLSKEEGADAKGKWVLGDSFKAPLKGTKHHVPVEPFGGTDDFDSSETHIVYTTKDPKLPPAWHTKQDVFIIPVDGSSAPRELTSGKQGATRSPVFSKQGDKVAWLELDEDGYESDRAKIVIFDLKADVRYTLTQDWDRSPDSLAFSEDGTSIFFTAGDNAHIKIFTLPLPSTPPKSTTHPSLPPTSQTPIALTTSHAASSIQVLPNGRLLYSSSSLTSPNDVFIIRGLSSPDSPLEFDQLTHIAERNFAAKGVVLDSGESFWFEGAKKGGQVHGWVVKPFGWSEEDREKGKVWPVVLLIHGGPQGAWEDQWSTRWNPNIFAQQGYFVIAINPTGSTTFGQELTDAIAEDWGGKPFVDLQKGWKYALKAYPEIDPDRAVAAGASWGGYAINWIQGHPEFGFNFKALVCHDGVFDAYYSGFATEELFFFNHEFGGRPWEKKSKAITDKYSPANFVHKWSTPQLVIHGSKDYRLPETDGIGAFHALQEQDIPSRLVIFPDENHWVLNHGNSLKWHYEVFRWFDKFVGDKKKH